jgi:hypothetical protein
VKKDVPFARSKTDFETSP